MRTPAPKREVQRLQAKWGRGGEEPTLYPPKGPGQAGAEGWVGRSLELGVRLISPGSFNASKRVDAAQIRPVVITEGAQRL